MDPSQLLSRHVKQYKSVSKEKLDSFRAAIDVGFEENKVINKDGRTFLLDFVDTLVDLYLSAGKDIIRIRGEKDKLSEDINHFRSQLNVALEATKSAEERAKKAQIAGKTDEHHSQDISDLEPVQVNAWGLPNVQQINLSKLVKKPRYFDGETPMPREWIEEFRDAMEDNTWTDQTGIYYFKHFLIKDAATWFKLSVRPHISSDWEWEDLFIRFERNYLGRAEKDRVKLLLKETKMTSAERAANFIPRIRQYLLMVSPDMQEIDQVLNIAEKMRPEYQSDIIKQDPKEVDELIDVCRMVEASKDATRAAAASSSSGVTNNFKDKDKRVQFSKRFAKPKGSMVNYQARNDKIASRSGTKPIEGKLCHRCGRNNHLIRDCIASTKLDGSRLVDDKKTTKGHHHVNVVVEEDNSSSDVEVFCNTITDKSPVNTNHLIFTSLRCNKAVCEAMVDSGSVKCLISEAVAKKHGWNVLSNSTVRLSGANTSTLDILGSVVLQTELNIGKITKRTKHRWFVARQLAVPMILGSDLMSKFEIIADVKNRKISFYAQQGFRASNDVEVPALCQLIVPTTVDVNGLVMTSNFNRGDNLNVANTISLARDNQAEVLVLNSTTKPVIIKKGTKLADIELLAEESRVTANESKPSINAVLPLPSSEQFINIGDDLTSEQISDLRLLLNEFKEAFSLEGELGCAEGVQHQIELIAGAKPIVEPARRRPQLHIDEAARQIEVMLDKGIIEESKSPWASAYVVVRKKNGDFRLCIDFRKLNSLTKKNAFPLPNIEDCLDRLSGKTFFSNFDFCSGYWQLEVEEKSRELTAFRTDKGHYQFIRMPFGLCNAPASFQKLMNHKFAGLNNLNAQVYLDDICIATHSWEEHKEALREFFVIVIKSNIKLNGTKCTLAAKELLFLGHIISREGIRQDPAKLAAITQMARPTNVHEIRRVIGLMNYYRRFVPQFAIVAAPLTNLTRKNAKFVWTDVEEKSYNELIAALASNATLAHFNNHDPVMLKTDACVIGIAGILLQRQNDEWKIVSCYSRKLNSAESNYGITHLEGLAVVDCCLKFKPYLIGRKFELLTDHSALKILTTGESKNSRIKRWQILLSEFEFNVNYIKGALHSDVDCLSRAPIDNNDYILDEKVCCFIIPLDTSEWTYQSKEDLEILGQALESRNSLSVKEDIIYKEECLYVPTNKREQVMASSHSSLRGGHGGQQVTLAKIKSFWWPSIIKDVIDYVKACIICQARKVERALPIGGRQTFVSYIPFHTIAIDTLGPLPESLSGYCYVIVAVDVFTRFVEARAIREVKAEECSSFVVDLFGRYGPPHTVITDNGPQFLNDLVKDTMKVFGVIHQWSVADHSQGNAPAERAIQTFQEKLSLSCSSTRERDSWDSLVPTVVLAMNSSICSSTGFTPYEMMFGREINIHDNLVSRTATPAHLHTQLIKANLDKIFNRAIEVQDAAKTQAKANFSRSYRERSYQEGDLVLMRDPNRRKGKLDKRFNGPFKVLEIVSKDTYKIQNVETKATYVRHSGSLKPSYSRVMEEDEPPVSNKEVNEEEDLDKVSEADSTINNQPKSLSRRKKEQLRQESAKIQRQAKQHQEASKRQEAAEKKELARKREQEKEDETKKKEASKQKQALRTKRQEANKMKVVNQVERQDRPATRSRTKRQSLVNIIIYSMLVAICIQSPVESMFQREPSQMWTWVDKDVFGEYVTYDIQAIIKSPCKSLQIETDRYETTKIEAHRESVNASSENIHIQMQSKCDHFDRTIFFKAFADLIRICVFEPPTQTQGDIWAERLGGEPYSKRGFFGSIIGGFAGVVMTDLVGVVWDYINPNSNYNRLNHVEAKIDLIEGKHDVELNAFKNVTQTLVQTFNASFHQINEVKGQLHQIVTDLPEYVFGASYILDFIIHGARLLDDISRTCRKSVNLRALAEFIKLPELNELDERDTQWVSITSVRPGAIRFIFRVAKKSTSTTLHGIEPFDIWDFPNNALMRYSGPRHMLFNRTANCAKAVELPEVHLSMERCIRKNSIDPSLKQWSIIRKSEDLKKEQQVTQMKQAGSQMWLYCPFGNITIQGMSVPCPWYVFSLPAGTGFTTADMAMPEEQTIRSTQSRNVDERLSAHFIHSFAPDELDLADSLAKLEAAAAVADRFVPITKHSPSTHWASLCLISIIAYGLGVLMLYGCLLRRNAWLMQRIQDNTTNRDNNAMNLPTIS